MDETKKLPLDVKSFKEIINNNYIYVDKTAYLANMIADSGYTWLLTRPRCFGKSLTVSTLESIFSGEKDLFKGLAIEKMLDETKYAPRPVIHLDMSQVATNGLEKFEESLWGLTLAAGKKHDLDLPLDLRASMLLEYLIPDCSEKYGQKVAVLIDEYDSPLAKLMDKPASADRVRKSLAKYYTMLKALEEYIFFVFLTSTSKLVGGGLYSGFNNYIDISFQPKYGALMGFTQEEIELYFDRYIDEAAKSQKMSRESLLNKMENYYNGFCFDAKTKVYNPHSTLLFLKNNTFTNFWFKFENHKKLISFMNENSFTVDLFRGLDVYTDRIEYPCQNRSYDPAAYFYQLGYLSLKPNQRPKKSYSSHDYYVLDYPNIEARQSMGLLLLESYFHSAQIAQDIGKRVKIALSASDHLALIDEMNLLLANIPNASFVQASQRHNLQPDDVFYSELLSTLFYSIALDPRAKEYGQLESSENSESPGSSESTESSGSTRNSEFFLKCGGQTWIIVIKVNHNKQEDQKLAILALEELQAKDYEAKYENPVLLALVVNIKAKAITAWALSGQIPARVKTPNK
ncbi:MAG: AAA family ATPase [Deltaproteobacteria bacterium]|nr:AAA family ATPase [Deltaproteobacteria bacterium]